MKRTQYIIQYVTLSKRGWRRVYEDEYGDQFVKLDGQIVSVQNPAFSFSEMTYYPDPLSK